MKTLQPDEKRQRQVASGRQPPSASLVRSLKSNENASGGALSGAVREKRILCVDDEIIGTNIRGEILREHGYSVVLFNCPREALHCDLSSFDLAILDYRMPRLNGRELLLQMRALGARFPILLLTGCLNELSLDDRRLFARCIDKGASTKYLLETIDYFLDPKLNS
jgi:CheY-like chemotaxis protein